MGRGGEFKILNPLSKSEQLRTLLPISIQHYGGIPLSKRVLHNIFPRLTSLRALSLSRYGIVELPDALFIKLKLLRFLDLSRTKIKKLPDSICVLYNLETLFLSDCNYLEELPLQMEEIINLRHLDISKTSRLKMLLHLCKLKSLRVLVGAKFLLGGPCSWRMEDLSEAHYLYGSLSILELQNVVDRREAQKANMREKNHVGKFPENLCSLTNLRISRCPELNLESPIQLSSLKSFQVDGSPKAGVVFDEAELFTSQLEGMKQIVKLDISDCNSLTSLPISTLPSTLKTLRMWHCWKLKLEAPASDMISNLFLMTSLNILYCKKLKRLPERMQELFPSLKELRLNHCPEIESFPDGGLPFNLQRLVIIDCKKLVNDRKEWRLQRLSSLRVLDIYHDGSDGEIVGGANWELPCSIQSLHIDNLKTFSSQLLKSLTSLECLHIRNLPQIQSLLEQGIPSSLSELHLYCHDELHSIPTEALGHLTSLRRLEINNCYQLHSLAESGFPSSLSKLTINNCPNLQSLPESVFPSSLSELTISNCPNLPSLPLKGMPSSLSKLSIRKWPLLKPLLEFDEGEYWPGIAHYSTIKIDDEYL
ncbi:hypothetical protein P3S67_013901 [Capsicum chacoense]